MPRKDKLSLVGRYNPRFNQLLKIDLPCFEIYQSSGLLVHIKRRHPGCVKYIHKIPEIIENPDYIGKHPKDPNSIKLVKSFDQNLTLAIKLDVENSSFYVATLFLLSKQKIENRVYSKKLIAFAKT